MKRASSNLIEDETKLSGLLFNKSKKIVEKLKKNIENNEFVDNQPVWFDEDDNHLAANTIPNKKSKALQSERLKQKYESIMGTPNWAKLGQIPENEDESEITKKVGHVHKKKSLNLPKDYLEIRRFPNINNETKSEGKVISCVEFHPKLSVALVGGQSGIVSLFSIGGDTNNKLHSFRLKKWKVTSAYFSPEGSEAYLASEADHSYCLYNLVKAEPKLVQLPHCVKKPKIFKLSPNGKYLAVADGFDEIHIICAKSNERLRALKHNSSVVSVAFSHNSEQMYCYCAQGEITIWDLSTYRALKKFYDNGCVNASCITDSPCGKLLAAGSKEGIVNVYDRSSLDSPSPFPLKTISNLTTKITDIKFNATSEIIAISSNCYPNAVKLVHTPSYHVFSNFPKQSITYNNIQTVNFSPNSGYMALGNDKGLAYLFRLKYYKNY
ncbi:U3 small nucleolar RNA-associated protein 18 homolog [Amyelois transitella]|uniref:U3 small nucleolar RNA-associated protein 18 homolog n=1 Tax=Amyelois transitella TaxID=680683 RepID=UPI00067B83B5|nr:U3 small nucleolar RNA-associated protein 18 homolog [Amyelois transitella]